MAGAEPFAAVVSALRGWYAEATPLETFIQRLGESGAGDAEVLRGDDAPCYRTFVEQCLVCVPRGARAIPRPFTFQQLSSQDEVIARVLQRLCEKGKKNVLAYGYSLLDENSSQFYIIPLSNIYSYLPNTSTETLPPSLKRKLHMEQLEIPAKRAKVEEKVREEKACNLTRRVNRSSSKRYETGKKFVAGESSLLQGVQNNKPLKSSIEMQAESRRKGVEMHMCESQLNSVQIKPVEGDHFVPADEHCFREELLAKFLYWLMDIYIVELLRSFFYITETMFQKNMLFYYRKFIWGKLQNIGISVLNYERTINTSFIGSSVFGKDDIYKTWKQFVMKVLESGGEIPHFYCVKVSTFKDFMPDMKRFVSQLQKSASLQNAIVVEQSLTFNETSTSLFNFFLQMIHNNVLEIGNRYYLQCCGIPQGSILSTLLCSLCYGDMENKLLCGMQQDG
ncbi:hypothetical protein BTVI_01585 [Pitangus sulphuratus]|nr:hypothetical protein BTVI_01585 [Pitangus sulphuratus]